MNKQEIEKAIEDLENLRTCEGLSSNCFAEVHGKNLEIAISALEQQLADRWIPVIEYLPTLTPEEVDDCIVAKPYLVTIKRRNEIYAIPALFYFPYQEWHNCLDKGPLSSNVIAWKPLPQPYKEVSDAERS